MGKLVTAGVGLIVIIALVRLSQKSLARYIRATETRYRARKVVTVLGYPVAFLFLGAVFSEKIGQFTVPFGVAGAGIAFALQEVIASIAGWLAISFGGYYSTGDRIQLGGIKGDVVSRYMIEDAKVDPVVTIEKMPPLRVNLGNNPT